jgi:hypothetical protein
MVLRTIALWLGIAGSATFQPPADKEVQLVDPATINFSISTIASELPVMEPDFPTVAQSDLVMHEDDWRQLEFYPRDRLAEVQAVMERLVDFEAEHRIESGFRNMFIRDLPSEPVLAGDNAVATLAAELGVSVASSPTFYYGDDAIVGRAANGFSLPLDEEVALYGIRDDTGVSVLGAVVGPNGDFEVLTRAFIRLYVQHQLIAVDWRAHVVVTSADEEGRIEAWRPD